MRNLLGTGIDRSGAITAGGTAQDIAPFNEGRSRMSVQNTSATDMRITESGVTATATAGYKLAPGEWADIETRSRVSVYCATTGATFASTEV